MWKYILSITLALLLFANEGVGDSTYNFICKLCNQQSTIDKVFYYDQIDISPMDEDTLVLIDVDGTILHSPTDYGNALFHGHLLNELMIAKGVSETEARLLSADRWAASQRLTNPVLVDSGITNFIRTAESLNAHVLAFTARQPELFIQITENQLAQHHLKFDSLADFKFSKSYPKQISPTTTYNAKAIFKHGILYVHDINSTGEVFTDFYLKLAQHLKPKTPLCKIIFISNSPSDIQSLQAACEAMGLEFHGYILERLYNYDHDAALKQEKELTGKKTGH
jgi:hypothetical protein